MKARLVGPFSWSGKIFGFSPVWWEDSAKRGAENSEGGVMSDEQRKDEETEVEAHRRHLANTEPTDEGNEVEAHRRHLANTEPTDEGDDEVEAHGKKAKPTPVK